MFGSMCSDHLRHHDAALGRNRSDQRANRLGERIGEDAGRSGAFHGAIARERIRRLHFQAHFLGGLLQVARALALASSSLAFAVSTCCSLSALSLVRICPCTSSNAAGRAGSHVRHIGDHNLVALEHHRLRDLTLLQRDEGCVDVLIHPHAGNRDRPER